ncbi:hypothetical protein GUJ93_ZPchr0004g38394 [Zizania palustris]|uniref:Uncharacterized protein n=1 Tax=Zizania palustris TaxID=103762 RepID=A0A8J5VFD3_ZIZPA|nr:hypothetical protein GUJ93_ZPchr0004g38394 [Zizania palustris]
MPYPFLQSLSLQFPFDLDSYLRADDEAEDASAPFAAPLLPEVKEVLQNMLRHLEDLVEVLVNDSGQIHGCLNDILNLLPLGLVDVLMSTAHLEFHRSAVQRALCQMDDRVCCVSQWEEIKELNAAALAEGSLLDQL